MNKIDSKVIDELEKEGTCHGPGTMTRTRCMISDGDVGEEH